MLSSIARELDRGPSALTWQSLLDAESGDGAAGGGGNGLLTLVAEPGGRQGADAVDGGSGRLCGGQVAGVVDRDGHGADQQVAAAESIRAGDGLHRAGDGLKGAVEMTSAAWPTANPEASAAGNSSSSSRLVSSRMVATSCPAVHVVTGRDFKGSDGAGNVGADVLGVRSVIVAALGLARGSALPFPRR